MDSIFEQAKLFLETESVLSSTWFANTFQLSALAAVQYLGQLKAAEADLSVSYLLYGLDQEGRMKYTVVREQALEASESAFQEVHSKTIYSVQKTTSANLAGLMVQKCLEQADCLLRQCTVDQKASILYNGCGQVSGPPMTVMPFGQRILSAMNRSNTFTTTSMPQAKVSLPRAATAPAASAFATSASASASKPTSAPVPAATLAPSTTAAAKAFFGSTATAKPKVVVKAEVKAEPKADMKAEVKAEVTPSKKRPSKDDSDDEFEADKPLLPRKMPVAVPKAAVAESEDESDTEDTDTPSDQPKKKKSKKNHAARGAMDDFMQDQLIKEEQQGGEKRKVRKLVEKTGVDERGYFVMEMVWEEVDDDGTAALPVTPAAADKENAPQVSANIPKPKVEKSDKADVKVEKKGKKAAAPVVPQKNMMSFFGKK